MLCIIKQKINDIKYYSTKSKKCLWYVPHTSNFSYTTIHMLTRQIFSNIKICPIKIVKKQITSGNRTLLRMLHTKTETDNSD